MVQLNLNLIFTHVWHANIRTNFSCHSQVTREKIIKIYNYTHVTLELLDKFIRSLTSCTRSEQVCLATRELHVSTEQICWATASCTRVHDLMHLWSALLTRNILTYYVTCKMHTWLWHLWITLQQTHRVVYSHCSRLHQPVIFQYHSDCYLNPSVSAY